METESIYYTFSTIPQVLAGVIALLGGLWIYRIENLNRKHKSTSRTILREMGVPIYGESDKFDDEKQNNRKLMINGLMEYGDINNKILTAEKADQWVNRLSLRMNSSIEQDDYDWIENSIILIDRYVNNEITNKTKRKFEILTLNKIDFTRNIKICIILSVITIIYNIGVLPFAKSIICVDCTNMILFSINAVLFLLSIIYIGYSIFRTLKI